ncbi:hypothetical protein [Burkholderia cenocepacia]|jgi:hypothetical protein|uniref:hypothetical protein n=1 Tax=Burkholderia cenocepacia TaxID=95486 RepID=UPI002653CFBE|nr:hypothetical protein [Burkholderia cenocepacia]MDN7658464.1 hypothetical protein [Burkholderia cenocepacia]
MNCKPGTLAMIRGMRMLPELNGRIVEIVHVAANGEVFQAIDGSRRRLNTLDCGVVWRVRGREALPWIGFDGTRYFTELPIRNSRLIPLGGVPVTDDIEDEVTA